ncbi:MAG: DUF2974 domain-containing protein [Erysipelotrichaceae bacterium]|nr:DUF2974 domain-containing protein [Erysipelotrichaceae bacterium]
MNIRDYIRWRGDISMKQDPFNEVDNLVFTQLAYLYWSNPDRRKPLPLKEAVELAEKPENASSLYDTRLDLAQLAAASNRFGDIKILKHVRDTDTQQEKQFAATTFQLPDKTCYVAFQGTDTSLAGWKEDFNMSFTCPVPAQKAAEEFLKDTARRYKYPLIVGGHSKGGNLAIYASVMLNHPNRIISVFSNDGPGFPAYFLEKPEYTILQPKMKSLIPQKSVVGRLMNNSADIDIVHSDGADLVSQHDIFTWAIDVNVIVREERNTSESQFFQGVFNQWNNDLSLEEKMVFMNSVYDVMVNTGIKTSSDISRNKLLLIKQMVSHISNMSEASRNICLDVIGALLRSNFSSFRNTFLEGAIRQAKKGDDSNENTDSE